MKNNIKKYYSTFSSKFDKVFSTTDKKKILFFKRYAMERVEFIFKNKGNFVETTRKRNNNYLEYN